MHKRHPSSGQELKVAIVRLAEAAIARLYADELYRRGDALEQSRRRSVSQDSDG